MDFDPLEIKHISLDVWGTMLKSNPEFAKARAEYVTERCNLNPLRVEIAFDSIKSWSDDRARRFGYSTRCYEAYDSLLNSLMYCPDEKHEVIQEIQKEVHDLFWKYPPTFPEKLYQSILLIRDAGRTVGISSNTNFITGNTIRQFLESEHLNFDFYNFSDLLSYAKPSKEFFKIVKNSIPSNERVYYMDILHIGNDKVFDYDGARHVGMHTLLVNNPDHLVQTLEKITE